MIYKLSRFRPLIDQIDDHLASGKTWSKLDYSEIEALAGHAIHALGKDADVCLTESDNLDLIMNLVASNLITGRRSIELAEALSAAASTYLHDHLKQLYNERADEREQEIKLDAGLRPWTNRQTGELEWTRA